MLSPCMSAVIHTAERILNQLTPLTSQPVSRWPLLAAFLNTLFLFTTIWNRTEDQLSEYNSPHAMHSAFLWYVTKCCWLAGWLSWWWPWGVTITSYSPINIVLHTLTTGNNCKSSLGAIVTYLSLKCLVTTGDVRGDSVWASGSANNTWPLT